MTIENTTTPPPLSSGTALLLFAGVISAIAGFIALGIFVHLTTLYAGFLFLWYWASVDKLDIKALPTTILGALGGIGTAWLLQAVTQRWGLYGSAGVLVLIALAIYIQIRNLVPLIVNASYMLFLTVAAAPLIQKSENFVPVIEALLMGTVFFSVLILSGLNIYQRFKNGSVAEARRKPKVS